MRWSMNQALFWVIPSYASELNRRNAFFEGGIEIDRVQPLVQRHVAIATHGADFNSELLAAITTLEEVAVSTPVGL